MRVNTYYCQAAFQVTNRISRGYLMCFYCFGIPPNGFPCCMPFPVEICFGYLGMDPTSPPTDTEASLTMLIPGFVTESHGRRRCVEFLLQPDIHGFAYCRKIANRPGLEYVRVRGTLNRIDFIKSSVYCTFSRSIFCNLSPPSPNFIDFRGLADL